MCCFVLTGAKSVRWLWGFEVMSGSGVVLGTASQLVRSQWSKAIFGNRRSNKLSGAQSSTPNHLHFPQPALFLLQAPQTVLNTLVGQVTLPMSGFDFWFSDSFSTSQQIKDALTLMLQFSYLSSHPPTPTPTFCPSRPHQHPISERDFWVQRAQVQNRIFCQKPGLPCHSHVWRQQAAIKHLHLWEPKHLWLHLSLLLTCAPTSLTPFSSFQPSSIHQLSSPSLLPTRLFAWHW